MQTDHNWGWMAFLGATLYAFLYFITMYPAPLSTRPEYMWVIAAFCVVILVVCCVIYREISSLMTIWNMRKEDVLKRELINKQNQELHKNQMAMMVAQIQPHFIYNTLNAIRTLIRVDQERGYKMCYDFSRYLRMSFETLGKNEYIPFVEELEHIRGYRACVHPGKRVFVRARLF